MHAQSCRTSARGGVPFNATAPPPPPHAMPHVTPPDIGKIRLRLILDQPFFGSMILGLKIVPDPTAPTAWTDGVSIGYNPDWLGALPFPQQLGVMAHEVMHVALAHNWRRGHRDPDQWNVAADYAVNPLILAAGLELPNGALIDSRYAGKSAEEIFGMLPARAPKQSTGQGPGQDGKGQGSPAPGSGTPNGVPGDVRDGSTDPAVRESAELATQAAAARALKAGDTTEAVRRLAAPATNPPADWRAILRDVVRTAVSREDYTWTRPSPRYVARGLYLPMLHSETLGSIAVAIDTSGSIDERALDLFLNEIGALRAEVRPTAVHYLECDTRVHTFETFEAADEIPHRPTGGGGTRFSPVFDALESLVETPACLIYFTDLECGELRTLPDPGYPVVWVTPYPIERAVPFGVVACIA